MHLKSRPAEIGDRLTTHNFGTGTRGFRDAASDTDVAVCLLSGTEIAFDKNVQVYDGTLDGRKRPTTAIFRQIHKENAATHHDALEFPNGEIVLLTSLIECQAARVLQLPAKPNTKKEAEAQKRLELASDWSFR